jgi:hypothetical protein
MAGVAFAVEGDGVGFATESYAASALYTTLASLSGALWRIRRARYKFALKDLKAHSNCAWEDNVRCNSISEAHGQNPRQPAVRSFENYKYDQPDTEDAQSQDQQALE